MSQAGRAHSGPMFAREEDCRFGRVVQADSAYGNAFGHGVTRLIVVARARILGFSHAPPMHWRESEGNNQFAS